MFAARKETVAQPKALFADFDRSATGVGTFMIRFRILLVEDESIIRLVSSEILWDAGFEVIEARDADEAVRLLDTSGGFDALFTDVQMAGKLDGIGVAMHARRLNPTMPVLVVSGYSPNLVARLNDLSPSALFFSKPYAMEEIVKALNLLDITL